MMHGSEPSIDKFVKGLPVPCKRKADDEYILTSTTKTTSTPEASITTQTKANRTYYNQ